MQPNNQDPISLNHLSPSFDINKLYENCKWIFKDAKVGKVNTRFAPEPFGYLNVGHLKSALLSYHCAKMYKGKFILRFDDVIPSKQKDYQPNSIIEDLALLGIIPDQVSYVSDYFHRLYDIAKTLISQEKAYCDSRSPQQIRNEITMSLQSPFRNTTPDNNLVIFEKMIKGEVDNYVLRGKIDYKSKNVAMRDPIFFKPNKNLHHLTGNKFSLYPSYYFSSSIVDSFQGITHVFLSDQYHIQQYQWIQQNLQTPKVQILQFSKWRFQYTCLNKKILQTLIDQGIVDGWDDPRLPTVRGLLRNGLKVQTLIQLVFEQDSKKNTILIAWDKLWARNKLIIDQISLKCSSVCVQKVCDMFIENGPKDMQIFIIPSSKNPALGNRPQHISSHIIIDFDDASLIIQNQKIVLMNYGIVLVKSKDKRHDGSFKFIVEYLPDERDFRTFMKLSWLCKDANLPRANIVDYDFLFIKPTIDQNDVLDDILNLDSKISRFYFVDPILNTLKVGDFLNINRRGYFRVDSIRNQDYLYQLIFIPDGKRTQPRIVFPKTIIENIKTKRNQQIDHINKD